ncbi:MAG: hypothetical protein O7G30_03670 [Proteobacteria bacterium]|nr:hypothetical protein [Pseudomonadota bacterium]
MDFYTRLLLTVIALTLVLITGHELGWIPNAKQSTIARFRVVPVPQARMLVRFDTKTGDTWHTHLARPDAWEFLEVRIPETAEHEPADTEPDGDQP